MDAVAALCSSVRQLSLELAESGVISGPPILSAGGSTYFDVVASSLSGPEPATVVLRSGGYVTHDDGLYSVATPLPSDLQPAIDVWAYVLSRPEPGRALIGAGRRDVPFDVALPIVRSASSVAGEQRDVSGIEVVQVNDQHGFLDLPATSDLAVGDRVCLGIAHPCTAFDKWRLVPIVADDGTILEIAHTLF
jgi:D-serine dehydratase